MDDQAVKWMLKLGKLMLKLKNGCSSKEMEAQAQKWMLKFEKLMLKLKNGC
jgi:hypothetical protein